MHSFHYFRQQRLLLFMLIIILSSCNNSAPELPDNLLVNVKNNHMLIPSGANNILTIGNSSNAVITWQASSDSSWLRLTPQQGTILPNGFITIAVKAGVARQGEEGYINFSSDLGDYRVRVEIAHNSCINPSTARPDSNSVSQAPRGRQSRADNFAFDNFAELERHVANQLIIRYEDDYYHNGYDAQSVISSQSLGRYNHFGLRTLQPASSSRPALVEISNMAALQSLTSHPISSTTNASNLPLSTLEQLAAVLSQEPYIRYAEPNYYLYPQGSVTDLASQKLQVGQITSDPLYGRQWYLKDFGLEQAWNFATGSPAVTVAVLDSSMDSNHEDLRGRLLKGCDIFDKDDDVNPAPPLTTLNAHGTHVTGIIAAVGANAKGVVGVAPEGVRILPLKVFDDAGRGTNATVVSDAIRWAAGLEVAGLHPNPYPAHIINLSLGGPGKSEAMNEAIEEVRRLGVLVVAASGNYGWSHGLLTPSNAPYALAVGSVDGTRRRSCFSHYNSDPSKRSVELVAPGGASKGFNGPCNMRGVKGEAIVNTFPTGIPQGNYGSLIGTSMATPFVAGVAALVLSQEPFLSADSLHARLLNSTLNTMPEYNRAEYGAGILCADRALGAATLCGESISTP